MADPIEPGLQIEDKVLSGSERLVPLSPMFDWLKAFGARPLFAEIRQWTGVDSSERQPKFGAPTNCAAAATPASCHGTFDAVSFAVDWQFAKKLDAYAGFMFSQVSGGLANGFLHRNTIDPTVGLRFRF